MSQDNTQTANDTGLEQFMAAGRALGKDAANGAAVLPKMGCLVSEAASNGLLSNAKDADGNDDLANFYIGFTKANAKNTKYESTVGGLKANVSKLRQIAIAAAKPTCDYHGTALPAIIAKHAEMGKAGEKTKALYAAMVDAARDQNAQDDDLSDDQIAAAVRKPEPADKTVEKELAAIQKRLEDLISGDKGVKCDAPELVDAYDIVRDITNTMSLVTRRQAAMAEAIELGLIEPEVAEAA